MGSTAEALVAKVDSKRTEDSDSAIPSERFFIQPGLSARSLEVFVAVARTGSMSGAAKQLGLTQPAISQSIAGLETSLGIQLFDRSQRPPSLTMQATALLPHALTVLDGLKKFGGALRFGGGSQIPLLRIGMPNSVAASMGSKIVQCLRDMAVETYMDSGFLASRFQSLVRREFDFIITQEETSPPEDVETFPLLTEPFMIVAPKDYKGRLSDIGKLSENLDFIRFGRDPHLAERLDFTFSMAGITHKRRYHLDTSEAVIQLVAAGAGWSVLPLIAVIKPLERQEPIKVIAYPGMRLSRTLMVALRKGEGRPIAAAIHKACLDCLRSTVLPLGARLLPREMERVLLHEVSSTV